MFDMDDSDLIDDKIADLDAGAQANVDRPLEVKFYLEDTDKDLPLNDNSPRNDYRGR